MTEVQSTKVQSAKCRVGLMLAMLAAGSGAHAQERAFEAGAQLALLTAAGLPTMQPGIAGTVAFVVNDVWALDGTLAYFPTADDNAVAGGRKVEGLLGVRAGTRWNDLAVFGKVRPGFVRYGRGTGVGVCVLIYPPPASCFGPDVRLALDIGGVFHYRLTRAAALRIDVGDTIVRRPLDGSFAHSLQINLGAVFRLR